MSAADELSNDSRHIRGSRAPFMFVAILAIAVAVISGGIAIRASSRADDARKAEQQMRSQLDNVQRFVDELTSPSSRDAASKLVARVNSAQSSADDADQTAEANRQDISNLRDCINTYIRVVANAGGGQYYANYC